MATNKQSLQLSQDLMEFQSRYNALQQTNTTLLTSARFFRDESFKYQAEVESLKQIIASQLITLAAFEKSQPKKNTRESV